MIAVVANDLVVDVNDSMDEADDDLKADNVN